MADGLLASRSKSAYVSVSHAQIFVRINWNVIDPDFVVEMRSGAASTSADVADGIAAVNMLARKYRKAREVTITRGDSVTVIKNDRPAVTTHKVGKFNHAIGWRNNRLPVHRSDINS